MNDQSELSLQRVLEKALEGTPAPLAAADEDLRHLVEKTSQAVQGATRDKARLYLQPHGSSADGGPVYQLYLKWEVEADHSERKLLAIISVPYAGYPVTIGESQKLADRTEVENWLRRMLSDPESPLIRYLNFWKWREEHYPATSGSE